MQAVVVGERCGNKRTATYYRTARVLVYIIYIHGAGTLNAELDVAFNGSVARDGISLAVVLKHYAAWSDVLGNVD